MKTPSPLRPGWADLAHRTVAPQHEDVPLYSVSGAGTDADASADPDPEPDGGPDPDLDLDPSASASAPSLCPDPDPSGVPGPTPAPAASTRGTALAPPAAPASAPAGPASPLEHEFYAGQDALACLRLAVLVDRHVAGLGTYDPLRGEGEAFAVLLRERAQAIVEAQMP